MIKHTNNSDDNSRGHGDMPFLVPLLDLTMILLFFFVIMSNAAQNVFDIKLPSADEKYKKQYTPLENDDKIIKLFIKLDNFMIDSQVYQDLESFKSAVNVLIENQKQTGIEIKDIKITVSSSKEVDVQKFLGVMTFLKSTGLEKVDIIMDSK